MGTEIEVPPLTLWVKARQDGTVPQHSLVQWNVSPNMATLLRRRGNEAAFVLLTGRTQYEDAIVLNRRFRRAFEVPTNRRSESGWGGGRVVVVVPEVVVGRRGSRTWVTTTSAAGRSRNQGAASRCFTRLLL